MSPKRTRKTWRTWDEVFLFYLDVKGYDHGYAAYRADAWRKRKDAKRKTR